MIVGNLGGGCTANSYHWIGRSPSLTDVSTDGIGSASEFEAESFFTQQDFENWHGSYAYIYEGETDVLLIVDTIASFPLFYAVKGDTIYVSDDAVLIAQNAKLPIDEQNVSEYLKASYVTETGTLFKDVFALNPGTKVRISKETGKIKQEQWLTLNYSVSDKKLDSSGHDRDYIKEFNDCLTEVFTDLAERLHGRKVLIPLSGGCDSRTVAATLKRVGYDNVFCLSYGKEGNFETDRSKIVAKTLGFEWFWCEYKGETWKRLLESKEYIDFIKYANVGETIGCIQALPAMQEVKKRGLVPDDTVVVPGHTLDVIMGSHLPTTVIKGWTKKNLIDYILKIHYGLNTSVPNGNIEQWTSIIPDTSNSDVLMEHYMLWEYRNRQSKFVGKDIRVYDSLGYSYEMPFWDSRVVKFASSLPFELLFDRKFQYEYTQKVIDPIVGLKLTYQQPSTNYSWLKTLLKKSAFVRYLLRLRSRRNSRFGNPCAFMEWMSDEQFRKYEKEYGVGFNLNSVEASDYIYWLREEIKKWD